MKVNLMYGITDVPHRFIGQAAISSLFIRKLKSSPVNLLSAAVSEKSTVRIIIWPPAYTGSCCRSTKVLYCPENPSFIPKTKLGKKLYALRTKAVTSGIKLFTEKEIRDEIRTHRGERERNGWNLC